MIRKRMSLGPASEGFTSTPVKSIQSQQHMDDGILSEDDNTFTRLSPIYNDTFESDDELDLGNTQDSRRSASPVRCELPRAGSRQSSAVEREGSPLLGPWELWLVNKAKEDRVKLEKKEEEKHLMKIKLDQEEVEKRRKKEIMEEKIGVWLKMKKEQERKEQLSKQSKEEEEMQRQQEKQRQAEHKAQQKYDAWLLKKKQEKIEREMMEKEEANLKAEEEKERRRKAEEKFQEWLLKADDRSRASPKPLLRPTSPYDKLNPSPGYYNPIPWKPIHVPPPESAENQMPTRKPQKQKSNAAQKWKNNRITLQN